MKSIIKELFENLHQDIDFNKDYSKIYKLHKYWARKPWYIVQDYISKYSQPNDVIMDPFCGSGCTGAEAVINNRQFIGHDINPIAILVSKGTLYHEVYEKILNEDFEKIKNLCKKNIMALYEVDEKCLFCNSTLAFKHLLVGPKYQHEPEGVLYCPVCNSKKSSKKRKLTKDELQKIDEYNNMEIPYWHPDNRFPEKFFKDRFSYKGILKVSDMYTNRNLYATALLMDSIKSIKSMYESLFMLSFTNTVLHVSKLKGENVRPLGVNNYWVPDDYIEENVWFRFEDRFFDLVDSKNHLKRRIQEKTNDIGHYEVSNKSALSLEYNESVDYVFTDPPYGDAIQYSELSYVWNSWLGETYEIKDEVIINPVQNKKIEQFNSLLCGALKNIYSALKPDKYFTLCFQNKDFRIWKDVINYCKELGFTLVDVSIYDTFGSPYNKFWAKFSPKTDIYVTFQKTSLTNEEKYFNQDLTLEDVIREILEYMLENNIELDAVKIYDITVSLLIWNLFYNDGNVNINKFDIKSFSAIVDRVIDANHAIAANE